MWPPQTMSRNYPYFFGRCMEHSLHLGAGHFVRSIAPTTSSAVVKRAKRVFNNARARKGDDLDRLDAELADIKDGDDTGREAPDDDEYEFAVADTVGKALALVKQVGV